MAKQVPIDDSAVVHGIDDDSMHQITPDLAYKRLGIVNIMYFGMSAPERGTNPEWVLIDAGMPGTADMIAGHAAVALDSHAWPHAGTRVAVAGR